MKIFTSQSPYTRWARTVAILWTLLIFLACLFPAKDLPEVDVPLIDKWTHFILFGIFAILWLCAYPVRRLTWLLFIFFNAVLLGAFVEWLQGQLAMLGRSQDAMDVLADAIGAAFGTLIFYIASVLSSHKQ